ncbi:MAG: PaaI family thioesterase [Caulobacteraceae bacterium]
MDAATGYGRRLGTATAEEMAGKTGLQVLRAMMAGDLPGPSISASMNFRLTEVDEGRAVFEGVADADFLNPAGTVHGGYLATLLDSCMTCAAQSTAGVGEFFTTVEVKVSYLRPVLPDGGVLRAEGTVIAKTRRTAFAEGKLTDAKGRLVATGSTTAMLIDRG